MISRYPTRHYDPRVFGMGIKTWKHHVSRAEIRRGMWNRWRTLPAYKAWARDEKEWQEWRQRWPVNLHRMAVMLRVRKERRNG